MKASWLSGREGNLPHILYTQFLSRLSRRGERISRRIETPYQQKQLRSGQALGQLISSSRKGQHCMQYFLWGTVLCLKVAELGHFSLFLHFWLFERHPVGHPV